MIEIGKRYSDVEAYLKDNAAEEDNISIDGFIKASKSLKEVMFAPLGDCKFWLAIPRDAVSSIEHRGIKLCSDPENGAHEHPYVQLVLDPGKKTAGPIVIRLINFLTRVNSRLARPMVQASGLDLHRGLPHSSFGARNIRYLGSPRLNRDNCNRDHPYCVNVGDTCPYRCGCVDEDGYGYCSTCCTS